MCQIKWVIVVQGTKHYRNHKFEIKKKKLAGFPSGYVSPVLLWTRFLQIGVTFIFGNVYVSSFGEYFHV